MYLASKKIMKKVLIVEDDPMLSEIYKKKFEKAGSFEAVVATSGTDAIKKAKQEIPDLVLLDLVLPEMDGFDVLAELKKDPTLKNTKVVPFSNLSEEDNEKKLRELKADGFIAKSEHTPQELVIEVEKILKNIPEKADNVLRGDLEEGGVENKNINNLSQKKVLIIDDDEVFLEVFGGELRKIEIDTEKALDGEEGGRLFLEKDFDLVVINLMLSDKKAVDLIKEFRSQKNKNKTKFAILKGEGVLNKDLEEVEKMNIKKIIEKDKIEPKQFALEIKSILE
jgi:two-component system alkaline phosphatase synthesis response regulator PhoP